uniref:Solute carrier family 23 member 2 n=1 Tax=Rhabditophanes sp. KR3021 TaxID=114890 RepID=A0AC35TWI0_9BILA
MAFLDSYPSATDTMLPDIEKPIPKAAKLIYTAKDVPKWNIALLLGFQQMMVGITGLLVMPYLVTSLICAGADATLIRVQLMSATLITAGVATLIQTTFGLRLCVYQGTAFVFLPPLIAFSQLDDFKCTAGPNDHVEPAIYLEKLRLVSGSLMAASLVMIICGLSGAIGKVSRYIGPVTITPLLVLLVLRAAPVGLEKAELHYVSIIQFITLAIIILFLHECEVPIPMISERKLVFVRYRLFGNFPYLIAIFVCWGFCGLLTITNIEPVEGEARVDKNASLITLQTAPWIQLPYPGQFGSPLFHPGLFAGFFTSCVICMIESIGSYKIVAVISQESPPNSSIISRAIIMEGLGCFFAGWMGVGVGVTTYCENVAVVQATNIASRITVQIAGLILISLGVFTKFAAILSGIPEALIGGLFIMSFSMILGVAFANLKGICLKNSRNVTIIGVAVLLGTIIPSYFETHPIKTGHHDIDNLLISLFKINMFIGGLIAFILDNLAPAATQSERGVHESGTKQKNSHESDGYWFPKPVNIFLLNHTWITKLPFMPSRHMVKQAVWGKNLNNNQQA